MAVRFAAVVPRMAVIGIVWLFATATLTYAAGEKLTTPVTSPATVATPRPILVAPHHRRDAAPDPRRPRHPRPGLRLRQGNPRGRGLCLASRRRRQGLLDERRFLAAPGTRHAGRGHRRTDADSDHAPWHVSGGRDAGEHVAVRRHLD